MSDDLIKFIFLTATSCYIKKKKIHMWKQGRKYDFIYEAFLYMPSPMASLKNTLHLVHIYVISIFKGLSLQSPNQTLIQFMGKEHHLH